MLRPLHALMSVLHGCFARCPLPSTPTRIFAGMPVMKPTSLRTKQTLSLGEVLAPRPISFLSGTKVSHPIGHMGISQTRGTPLIPQIESTPLKGTPNKSAPMFRNPHMGHRNMPGSLPPPLTRTPRCQFLPATQTDG